MGIRVGSYSDIWGWRENEPSEDKLKEMAAKEIKWAAETEDAYFYCQFYLENGIEERTWLRWCDKYPIIKDAHNITRNILKVKRQLKVAGVWGDRIDRSMLDDILFYSDEAQWVAKFKTELQKSVADEVKKYLPLIVHEGAWAADATNNKPVEDTTGIPDGHKEGGTDPASSKT